MVVSGTPIMMTSRQKSPSSETKQKQHDVSEWLQFHVYRGARGHLVTPVRKTNENLESKEKIISWTGT